MMYHQVRGKLTDTERSAIRALCATGYYLRSSTVPDADVVDAMVRLDVQIKTNYAAQVALRAYHYATRAKIIMSIRTLTHQTVNQEPEHPYGLFLTDYEARVLCSLLKDFAKGKPMNKLHKALALRISKRFLRCPDCGTEHDGKCQTVIDRCQYLVANHVGVLRQCGEIAYGVSIWERGASKRCGSHVDVHQRDTVATILDADCDNCGHPRFAHIAPNDTACRIYDARHGVGHGSYGQVIETRSLGGVR